MQSANKNIGVASQCLQITEKVTFNIASEASYIYILNRQKLSKMLNLVNTWESEACGRTVLPDKTKWQKFKIQMTHFHGI